MENKTLKITIITIVSFAIYYFLQEFYFVDLRKFLNEYINNIGIAHFVTYLIFGIPLFIGLRLIHDFKKFPEALGLNQSLPKALLFALLCTTPMLIGYAFFFDFNTEITFTKIFAGAIVAAFIEELFFRGILFGQIYRFTKIGFVLSIVFGALLFAFGHLYQSHEITTLIGIFATTFSGAILFAWVYVEWNNNLWVPIFLHLFMNLFWMLFSVSNNALGDFYANIFRSITILLIITLTITYKLRKGEEFEVNKNTLFLKSS